MEMARPTMCLSPFCISEIPSTTIMFSFNSLFFSSVIYGCIFIKEGKILNNLFSFKTQKKKKKKNLNISIQSRVELVNKKIN
jgi:hypothetical protein